MARHGSFVVSALLFFLVPLQFAVATGASESASSTERGTYLAAEGIIIPPDEVIVDSYVASIDYDYPIPEEDLAVYVDTGNRRVSQSATSEVIQIGIRGTERDFEELPPLNIAFVIDHSGSMSGANKLEWVKDALSVFVRNVRPTDYVSLIQFDDAAQVVFPSTRMVDDETRERLRWIAWGIQPAGGTNLTAGLQLGYEQVMANYRTEYTNRVFFLTDGQGSSGGMMEMAREFREIGVNVSTIGVGTGFDAELMRDLARAGGGSSRFISDREEMEEIFGSELDRMAVPVAREMTVTVELADGIRPGWTYGYDHEIAGGRVVYYLPTLHNRDYETMLLSIEIQGPLPEGETELGTVTVAYENLEGERVEIDPIPVSVLTTAQAAPVVGVSTYRVIRSKAMLDFALGLQEIGRRYYGREETERASAAMAATRDVRAALMNARMRLDNVGFDDELFILDRYVEILGREMEVAGRSAEWEDLSFDTEFRPAVPVRDVTEHLQNLFEELLVQARPDNLPAIAVATFSGEPSDESLKMLVSEMAFLVMGRDPRVRLVERDRIDSILEEQELSLSALMDTDTAIRIGRLMAADYLVTGTIIETVSNFIVFGRLVGTETAEVAAAAQVVIPRE
ncbi:MAG: FlgO family outer membrane protein [Spirochaetia bacterium]